ARLDHRGAGPGSDRHPQAIPGREGAVGCGPAPVPRRSPHADGPERRRQVDPHQGPHRRLPARARQHRPRRDDDRAHFHPGRAAARHQHGVPGGEPVPEPVGRGKHLHRTLSAPLRDDRLARHAPPGNRTAGAPADPHRRQQALIKLSARGAADGGDRARPEHFKQGPDPRRAHLQPRRERSPAAVLGAAFAARAGHGDPVRHPFPRPDLCHFRPHHRH
ncbi:MAG: ABC transporter, ATP-binding protein (cluster 2, ribose/xylose/arabinose/galactose) / ABC transporter, ATP-binding protein (cluster 2, ribose/xylose/arabinose/galactose), partial [uncultured Lysobacter sp.]